MPSRQVVAVLLLDSMNQADREPLRASLLALLEAVRATHLFRVALLRGEDLQITDPVKTRVQLQMALRALDKAQDQPTAVTPHIYTLLGGNAAKLGSNWTTLLLIGRLPAFAPEVQAYCEAYLSEQLRNQRIRVSLWSPGTGGPPPLQNLVQATGGIAPQKDLSELTDFLIHKSPAFTEMEWTEPDLAAGFVPYSANLLDKSGNSALLIPTIARAQGIVLPPPELFQETRQMISALEALLHEVPITEEHAARIRSGVERALATNIFDPQVLRVGAQFYRLVGELESEVKLLGFLTEHEPRNASLFSRLGHAEFEAGSLADAEKHLLYARELNPGDALVAEDLGRIKATQQDYKKALEYIAESLAVNPNNQQLWFLRAHAASQAGEQGRDAEFLEEGLKLGGENVTERRMLIRQYLEAENNDRALYHIRRAMGALPSNVPTLSTFAGFLDQLGQREEALNLWRRTVEVDPSFEPAHYRITQLLLDLGDTAGAIAAANRGLVATSGSARLFMVKAAVQEKLGRWYDVRRTLQEASARYEEVPLLRQAAEVEELFGQSGSRAYAALAAVLEKSSSPPSEIRSALERGLRVSLRDNDLKQAKRFAARLRAAGWEGITALTGDAAADDTQGIWVPGGVKALTFVAQGREARHSKRFLAEFSRMLVDNSLLQDRKTADASRGIILQHFDRVHSLSSFGKKMPDGSFEITISVQDNDSQQTANKVLNLLGWEIRAAPQGIAANPIERGPAAENQITAAALGVNVPSMQENLQAGKPFTFMIPFERVPVVLNEATWRSQLYTGDQPSGGFAEALVRDLRIARIYAGLSVLDDASITALLSGTTLKVLAEKHADSLYHYSSALAATGQRVQVPGGEQAEPIWMDLIGADPRDPAQFFGALLQKDDGKLIAFYFALAQVDFARQRFFTRNGARTAKFYELFKEMTEGQSGAIQVGRETPVAELFRNVPLDGNGHIKFPGGPGAWTGARGPADSAAASAIPAPGMSKVVSPEAEDQILIRLVRSGYGPARRPRSEWDSFIAIAQLDEHRREPLDEASVLILAQEFPRSEFVWPYFAIFTDLKHSEFLKFSALAEKFAGARGVGTNDSLGQIYSLLELLSLLRQSGRLNDRQAAELFSKLCDRSAHAASRAEQTASSLELLREILKQAGGGKEISNPDAVLRDLLLPPARSVSLVLNNQTRNLETASARRTSFETILEKQRVTSLSTLLDIYDALRSLSAGSGDPQGLMRILESSSSGLLTCEIPKGLPLAGEEKENLEAFQPKKILEMIGRLRQFQAKQNISRSDLEKLCRDMLEEISPQVRIALSGPIYAYYMRPDNTLIAEDPLFLRKHQFVKLNAPARGDIAFLPSDLAGNSAKGMFLLGGFADVGLVAGKIAAEGLPHGEEIKKPIVAAQTGALRVTRWEYLKDEDLRLVGLKVRAAREWIVQAAGDQTAVTELAEATFGLLSLTRRAVLLQALHSRDWHTVWDSLSAGDLYFLCEEYLKRHTVDSWKSPTMASLRMFMAANDGSRLQWLGASLRPLITCSHPHLLRLAPHETYERMPLYARWAARLSEYKLYLSEYFDRSGLPAAAMGVLAEPLARLVFQDMHMLGPSDSASVLAACAGLNDKMVEKALQKN